MNNNNHQYRPDIDGLRAIAVLCVVIFHASPPSLKGGFIGVDIFFVISGFLISKIILQSLDDGTFSISQFYARRIRRIFPAVSVVLLACLIAGWFALLADEYKQLGRHTAAGASFISNFALWNEAGYFDNAADTKPLLHLWSLGIEEQFYLIWPFILWIGWKCRINLLAVTIFFAALSFALNMKGVKHDAVATFYSPQTRFWELACGGAMAWYALYKKDVHESAWIKTDRCLAKLLHCGNAVNPGQTLSNVLSIAGFSILVFGLWKIDKNVMFPGVFAMIPVASAILLISAGPDAWLNRNILSNKVIIWFGLISFPLYLWHWPLLSFARIIESGIPVRSIRIGLVFASVALAWGTYRFVERPMRFGSFSRIKVSILVISMALLGVCGYHIFIQDGMQSRAAIIHTNAVNAEFVGPLWKYTNNETCESKYKFAESKDFGWWFCMANSDREPTILILGNSYANHLYPGIVLNEHLKHNSVLSIGTCDPAWVSSSDLSNETDATPCSGYRRLDQQKFIDQIILSEKSIRYVIVGGMPEKPTEKYIRMLHKRIDFFESKGIAVILFVPHVKLNYDIRSCYGRPFQAPQQSCKVSSQAWNEIRNSFGVLIDSINATNPKVAVFDQNIAFCTQDSCNFKHSDMPILRDEFSHLSEYGSKLVFDKFVEWAKKNKPEILAPMGPSHSVE